MEGQNKEELYYTLFFMLDENNTITSSTVKAEGRLLNIQGVQNTFGSTCEISTIPLSQWGSPKNDDTTYVVVYDENFALQRKSLMRTYFFDISNSSTRYRKNVNGSFFIAKYSGGSSSETRLLENLTISDLEYLRDVIQKGALKWKLTRRKGATRQEVKV